MSTIFKKVLGTVVAAGLLFGLYVHGAEQVSAVTSEGQLVGMTYYGGRYDSQEGKWIVDSTYQCDRIETGEFSVEKLRATPTEDCDDDPGYGYFDYIPLHNTMSYAELSNPPSYNDCSALGDLPARTRLQVEYKGKCAILEKLDVGSGGYAVRGYPRSIDLWWETARSLGFTNGFDVAKVSYVDQNTPLTPLGQTSACKSVETPPSPSVNVDTEEDGLGSDSEKDTNSAAENDKNSKDGHLEKPENSKKDEDHELAITVTVAAIVIASALLLIFYPKKPRLRL